ncbi:MAG: LON peptidase substrate-binding domain-containing protein, partial [Actinomycetes bacterium]
PYLRGEVDLLDEPGGESPEAAADAVRALFGAYRRALSGSSEELPADAGALSYLVAAAAVLDLTDRQNLLEAPDTTERLRRELRLLRRETALLGLLPSLPGVDLPRTPASPN